MVNSKLSKIQLHTKYLEAKNEILAQYRIKLVELNNKLTQLEVNVYNDFDHRLKEGLLNFDLLAYDTKYHVSIKADELMKFDNKTLSSIFKISSPDFVKLKMEIQNLNRWKNQKLIEIERSYESKIEDLEQNLISN